MPIEVAADIEARIRQKVERGDFPQRGEVIREAMRLLASCMGRLSMGSQRFDLLIQSFARDVSRRRLLAALAGGFLARLSLTFHAGARKKKRRKKKKRKKSQPAVRIDAACPGPGTGDSSITGRFAQTFTPERSGELVRVETLIRKGVGTSGDYAMHVATVDDEGAPTNNLLASTGIPNEDVITGPSLVTFDFANSATVEAGTDYALIWSRSQDLLFVRGYGPDSCPGKAFGSQSLTGEFFVLTNTGDFVFTTFVRS